MFRCTPVGSSFYHPPFVSKAMQQSNRTNKQVMEGGGFVLKLLQYLFSDYYCCYFFICVWVHFKVLVLCNNN